MKVMYMSQKKYSRINLVDIMGTPLTMTLLPFGLHDMNLCSDCFEISLDLLGKVITCWRINGM